MFQLPAPITPAEFDALCEAPATLLKAAATIARQLRLVGELTPMPGGANFVVAVGPWNVIKLFPPFQHYQWEAESRVLKALDGVNLPVAIPQFRAAGELDGWGYVAMSRLNGNSLQSCWFGLDEHARCEVLEQIGVVMAAVHSLPTPFLPVLDPPWELFWEHQRERCLSYHQRLRALPEPLLAELPAWFKTHVPELAEWGPRVLLTGEYSPENLLLNQQAQGWALTGMYDFADAMLGPARYDWLGPICFLVQGQRARLEAWIRGYRLGEIDEPKVARKLLADLLMHRYSHPEIQLQLPDWQKSASLDALAFQLWPLA